MNTRPKPADDLPGLLGEIAEIAGRDAAFQLARSKGGRRVFFPKTMDADHWLPRLVGGPAALALAKHYGGGEIKIPMGEFANYKQQKRARIAAMQEAIDEGLPSDEAARAAGVDRSTLLRFKAKQGKSKDPRQRELF